VSALYFAYGSNMSSARLRERIGSADALGAASLPGFRLVFNKPSLDGSGKANLVAALDAITWGVLWWLGRERWTALDAFEPGYRRAAMPVQSRSMGRVEAEVYLYDAPHDVRHEAPGGLAPFDWYVDHLIDGAREHALPESWLATLRAARRAARPPPPR
jgi:hypothetical protein